MEPFIQVERVRFEYDRHTPYSLMAVCDVSMEVPRGGHIAVLGRNGSGKSTLARLLNALEVPDSGRVLVLGQDTADDASVWDIRRACGMVFQNPDNQIVGTTVEEDVAFGPENIGMPREEMRAAVDRALSHVGLSDAAKKEPHLLSGGQKQKLAIAGILAMQPQCLILDEATSMLDPVSRTEFIRLVTRLGRENGLTVVNITHDMEEVLLSDHVLVLSEGKTIMEGTPAEIFDHPDKIQSEGLDVPAHIEITHRVAALAGVPLMPLEASTQEGAVHAVLRVLHASSLLQGVHPGMHTHDRQEEREPGESVITVNHLSHTYTPGTPYATESLHDVSFSVRSGELLGIVGHSGSGKSTLIQHLNGLIRPAPGTIRVLGMDPSVNADIRKIRQRVALLFQYPEHQLFEETVFEDVAFGPRKMGLDKPEVERRVREAAQVVGLSEADLQRSPFELSGGQKRRAAIAGVLSMEPDILVLDEPAAGLDPAGRDEILGYVASLRERGITILLVSHSMDDIARLADRVLVLANGGIVCSGSPAEVFTRPDDMSAAGLMLPATSIFLMEMKKSIPDIDPAQFTPENAAKEILRAWTKGGNRP
ncbi:MAG: energy-coupling factor transporter ATPase [Clostridiaceae bacterium]|nr:energy-coupling factor transporter ATPase [Clostridiaceae bacterium]